MRMKIKKQKRRRGKRRREAKDEERNRDKNKRGRKKKMRGRKKKGEEEKVATEKRKRVQKERKNGKKERKKETGREREKKLPQETEKKDFGQRRFFDEIKIKDFTRESFSWNISFNRHKTHPILGSARKITTIYRLLALLTHLVTRTHSLYSPTL